MLQFAHRCRAPCPPRCRPEWWARRARARLCPPYRRASTKNRLGGVANRLDVLAGIEEGDDPAGTALEPLVAPGERTDQRALVEHQLVVAAEILRVQQPLLECPVVERKHVRHHAPLRFLM